MAIEVGQLTKRYQGDTAISDPMNLRLVWRLSASSTPPYVSTTRATPERYILLVLADGYQNPKSFDAALAKIVAGVKADLSLADLWPDGSDRVYRDLQIWSLYYPEFAVGARPGPASSTFLERHFSELHMLSSPHIYPRTNELRRAIKNQHGLHVDKVLILANVTERGAGHTGGCLVVAGENESSYRLFLHEMGHAIGLGDEYFWEDVDIPVPQGDDDYPYPNVSKFATVDDRKDFLNRGAMYTTSAFRLEENCVMRDAEYGLDGGLSGWASFCEICKEQFRKFFILRQNTPPSAGSVGGGHDDRNNRDGAFIETAPDPGPFPLTPKNQKQNLRVSALPGNEPSAASPKLGTAPDSSDAETHSLQISH